MRLVALLALLMTVGAHAQNEPAKKDTFAALAFLQGTWEATATRPDGVAVHGTYSFAPELRGTVLARHSTDPAACKGPKTFDCEHGDLLYVFEDAPGQLLKAIYFDNEGHVIHYEVTTPSPTTAMFQSDGSVAGPKFRLVYERRNQVLSGKFQMMMPGQSEWKSYLEWSGAKQAETK